MKIIRNILKIIAIIVILAFIYWGYYKLTPIEVTEDYKYKLSRDYAVEVVRYYFYEDYAITCVSDGKYKKYYYSDTVDLTELKEFLTPYFFENTNPQEEYKPGTITEAEWVVTDENKDTHIIKLIQKDGDESIFLSELEDAICTELDKVLDKAIFTKTR